MGKLLKPLAIVGAIAVNVIPGIGQAISGALVGAMGGTFAAVGAAATITSLAMTTITLAGLSAASSILAKKPRVGLPDLDRLAFNTAAYVPRKMVFGHTALASDIRYTEPFGKEQRYVEAIVHLASHKLTAVERLYFGDKLAWTATGGPQGEFAGFLQIQVILECGAGAYHTVNTGSRWGSAQRMTGCATMKIRIDRQGTKRADSPFAGGLPPQVCIIGKGMPVYDPRRDSTVPGGSGPHRVHDQSTWQYQDGADILGDNPALAELAWWLGWRINGEVSVGMGLPVDRLDLVQYAAAANACDEAIALEAGGTQRRYTADGMIHDNDAPDDVTASFSFATNGWLTERNGKIGRHVSFNDLANVAADFNDDDVVTAFEFQPFPELADQFNIVRGANPDPRVPALFQPTDYPEVGFASIDGIDRVLNLNLALVQDKSRAQRIAKQALQRQQYKGMWSGRVGVRGWLVSKGDVVRISSLQNGWINKLFRVVDHQINMDATVDLELREEHPDIYQWDKDERPTPAPAEPVRYDPRNNPYLITSGDQIGVEPGATRNAWRGDWEADEDYLPGDMVRYLGRTFVATEASRNKAPPTSASDNDWWDLMTDKGQKGEPGDGQDGIMAVSLALSRASAMISTHSDGSGGDYSYAKGKATLREGNDDVSSAASWSVAATNCVGGVDGSGNYAVTSISADTAVLTITADYGGEIYTSDFTLSRITGGHPHYTYANLPAGVDEGEFAIVTDRDNALYTYRNGGWRPLLNAPDVVGLDDIITPITDDVDALQTRSLHLEAGASTMDGGDQYFEHGTLLWGNGLSTITNPAPHAKATYHEEYVGDSDVLAHADERWNLYSQHLFPVLPGRTYKIRIRIRVGTNGPTSQCYLGVHPVLADGTIFGGNRYFGMSGEHLAAGWHEREGKFTLDDLPAGTTKVSLVGILNYQNSTVATGVSYLTITDVTDVENIGASLDIQAGAISALQGENVAYLDVVGSAGSSAFFMTGRARQNYGDTPQSDIAFGATTYSVFNPADANNPGQWKKALEISNGNATFFGKLTAGSVDTPELAFGAANGDVVAANAIRGMHFEGPITAPYVQLDGARLAGDGNGNITIKPDGVDTEYLAFGATAGGYSFAEVAGTPPILGVNNANWNDVVINSKVAQITVVNNAPAPGTVIMPWVFNTYSISVPGGGGARKVRLRLLEGATANPQTFRVVPTVEEWTNATLWVAHIPANTTRTYKVQVQYETITASEVRLVAVSGAAILLKKV